MRLRFGRLLCAGFVAFMMAFAVQPARADLGETIINALLDYGGVDPDAIEMTRYTIRAPEHAAKVFGHAASYDIPFFAIVGAVKAMKGRTVQGVTFDEGLCMTPYTVIDEVFGASSSFIDDGAAKVKTDGAVDMARQYAVSYMQQQNDAAKQEVIGQIAENVPYFGELPTICDFAFHTSFEKERNLQDAISQTARSLRDAYNAFADGEIGDGVEHLLNSGISAEVACALADNAVSGGAIGKTPILGDIATGACKGFAGTIIKGIASGAKAVVEAGEEFVEDAVCAIQDIFSDCEAATPPPPTGIGNAKIFCAPFGGIKSAISKTNAPDDYAVICNDGSACRAKPGEPVKCQSGARRDLNEWARNFWDVWSGRCEDDQCRAAMPAIRDEGFAEGIRTIAADPTIGWPALRATAIAGFEERAATEVASARARINELNKSITSSAAEGWEQLVIAAWGKKCWDEQCRTEVQALAAEFRQALVDAQAAEPDASSLSIQGKVGKVYGPKFQAVVTGSDKRRIVADPNSTADEKLAALDCTHFLGRDKQWLCPGGNVSFDICVGAVKAGGATLCYSQLGLAYGTRETTTSVVKSQKCTPAENSGGAEAGLAFLCPDEKGRGVCERFIKGGMAVECNAFVLTALPPPVLAVPPLLQPLPAPPTQQGVSTLPAPPQPLAVPPMVALLPPPAPPVAALPPLPRPNPVPVAPPLLVLPPSVPPVLALPPATMTPPPGPVIALPPVRMQPPPAPPIVALPPITMSPPAIALALPPPADPETAGCGRQRSEGEWLCPDARAFAGCVAAVQANGNAKMCIERDNGARYGAGRQVVAHLAEAGCRADGGGPLSFTCAPEGLLACQSYGTGGMQVACKPLVMQMPAPAFQLAPGMLRLPAQ